MKLAGIAVVGKDGVIGDGEDQPFKIKEDWARFKRLTMGHPMIMGRRTWDAIGRALPGRTSIVVTRSPQELKLPDGNYAAGGVIEALALAQTLDGDEAWVVGGGEIYRAFWDFLTDLEITWVDAQADGDVTFPAIGPEWREVAREPRDGFAFVSYARSRS